MIIVDWTTVNDSHHTELLINQSVNSFTCYDELIKLTLVQELINNQLTTESRWLISWINSQLPMNS